MQDDATVKQCKVMVGLGEDACREGSGIEKRHTSFERGKGEDDGDGRFVQGRSVLYMPGSNARALEKGKTLPADGLILDLEDAVAPDCKAQGARASRRKRSGPEGYGKRELLLRVNAMNTPWGYEDLIAAAHSGADAVLLPKVDSADTVRQAEAVLEAAGAPSDLSPLVHDGDGERNPERPADRRRQPTFWWAWSMGTSDLAKELHCAHTAMRLPMVHVAGGCASSRRALQTLPSSTVSHLDLSDDEGFRASVRTRRGARIRRQNADSPEDDRGCKRGFRPHGGGGGAIADESSRRSMWQRRRARAL